MTIYSSMQRFKDALKGKPRDHVPIYPMIASWVVKQFSTLPLSELLNKPDAIIKMQIRTLEELGHDALFAYSGAYAVPEAFGCKVQYEYIGAIVEPLSLKVESMNDLDTIYWPDPKLDGRLLLMYEVLQGLSVYGNEEIPVVGSFEGPLTIACRIIKPALVMRMALRNRKVLEALLDRLSLFLLELGHGIEESGGNLITMPEPAASATMISPLIFRELVLPQLKKIIAELKSPCILHICGDTSPILHLMGQCGAAVLSLDQCMDLRRSRSVIPGQVLGGNVDPVNSLLMGDKKKVAENTHQCLEAAGTEKYILMSGCGVPSDTSIENVRTMIRTAIDYGLGPD